jgi:hypothetical protein
MVRAPRGFVDQVLWPEFGELDRALRAYLHEVTQLAQSGVELGSCFVAAGESNQGLGCLLGADFGM